MLLGDIRTRTTASLHAVIACLEAAHANLDDVVNRRIYGANPTWYSVINDVYASSFHVRYPTRTLDPVASWREPFDLDIAAWPIHPSSSRSHAAADL